MKFFQIEVCEDSRRCFALSNSRILVADSDNKIFTVKDIVSGDNYGFKKFENFCRVATIWEEETQSDLIFVLERRARKIQVFDATLTPLFHREIDLPGSGAFGENPGDDLDIQLVAANHSLLLIKPTKKCDIFKYHIGQSEFDRRKINTTV